jgi:hypothetical protein
MAGPAVLRDALMRAVAEHWVRPSRVDAVRETLRPLEPHVAAARLINVSASNKNPQLRLVLQWRGSVAGLDTRRHVVVAWDDDNSPMGMRFWVYDEPGQRVTFEHIIANEIERHLDPSLAMYDSILTSVAPDWETLIDAVNRESMSLSPRDPPPSLLEWVQTSWRWMLAYTCFHSPVKTPASASL